MAKADIEKLTPAEEDLEVGVILQYYQIVVVFKIIIILERIFLENSEIQVLV